jgi:NhaP-type Na+/H+ or K+/H+ antiporter
MVFAGLGLILGQLGFNLVSADIERRTVHMLAEVTLILVLFSDASRVKFSTLKKSSTIPARMLLIGMPLTILLGAFVARWVSPDQPWALAFLVAAILTPTDAALGQSVVTNKNVPDRIGQTINVESGLNDGLALPVVLVAAIFATSALGASGDMGGGMGGAHAPDNIALFAALQITVGPLAGGVIGFIAAKCLDAAVNRKWTTDVAQGLYILSVAVLAFFGAELLGGNGFISAFVAGLVFGNTAKSPVMYIHEFMEGEGQILTLLTFLVFGAVLAPIGLEHANLKTLGLAVLFLTLVRMLPIWLSLSGTGLSTYEKLFLGWFGPRGLASILFALLVLEEFHIPGGEELAACVVLTVLLSIVAHGLTANPLSNIFGRNKNKEAR